MFERMAHAERLTEGPGEGEAGDDCRRQCGTAQSEDEDGSSGGWTERGGKGRLDFAYGMQRQTLSERRGCGNEKRRRDRLAKNHAGEGFEPCRADLARPEDRKS